MGVKGTVTDAETGKAIPNALIQVKNVTRVGKGHRRSDLINHDVTSGKFPCVPVQIMAKVPSSEG